MLKVSDFSFAYQKGRRSFSVFEHLDISFSWGVNVILGPNGAGKTTLLKSIFGILNYQGDVFYGERNIRTMTQKDRTRLMSYLPQMDDSAGGGLTGFEMVLLGRLSELKYRVSSQDHRIVHEVMTQLNITSLAGRMFNELSGGQKKMIYIAQTLVRKPRVILMDEPVNSLDLQKQLELCSLLRSISRERHVDIITVLHDIPLASQLADHIVVVDQCGRVHSAGKPEEVITPDMIRDVFGVIADVGRNSLGKPVIFPVDSVRNGESEQAPVH